MALELNAVDVALTLGFMGSSIALRGSFAKSRPWNLAPQAQCGPAQLLSTPVLLICEKDESIILATVASFLCSIVVGQGHKRDWRPHGDDLHIGDGDESHNALRWRFNTCSPDTGLLHFDAGNALPSNSGVTFAGGNFERAQTTSENWLDFTRYPRPDECAQIWRRLVHLAPDAAPSVGRSRRKLTAVTLQSVLDNPASPLKPIRIRIGSKNSWTRLLGPGVPAVLISDISLYNSNWRPWAAGSIPKPNGTLWLQATGLAALQREARPSPRGNEAMIADLWMTVARDITITSASPGEARRSMAIWCIRKPRDKEIAIAKDGWATWSPRPEENIEPFGQLPWVVE